jgi:hypothetical protein
MALLQQFAGAAASGKASGPDRAPAGGVRSLVQRDEKTGETYLKLPVPPPEVLDQAARAFGALLESFRR